VLSFCLGLVNFQAKNAEKPHNYWVFVQFLFNDTTLDIVMRASQPCLHFVRFLSLLCPDWPLQISALMSGIKVNGNAQQGRGCPVSLSLDWTVRLCLYFFSRKKITQKKKPAQRL